jgi:predicted RNase H-like HicB family nuclease
VQTRNVHLEEARENLKEVIAMVLHADIELAKP